MKIYLKNFLNNIFPYISVLILWYFNFFWNPNGYLSLIPIFYFSFIKPINFYFLFSIFFLFIIDYCSDSLLFFSFYYCVIFSINYFQSFIDITNQQNGNHLIFFIFISVPIIILTITNSFLNIFTSIFFIIWIYFLYIIFIKILEYLKND